MVQKLEYNGYTNYETWNCALWLDNGEGTQSMMQEKAVELVEAMDNPNDDNEIDEAKHEMAEFLETMVNEMYGEIEHKLKGMFADFVGASMREIDYRDIAQSQLADALLERQESFKGAA